MRRPDWKTRSERVVAENHSRREIDVAVWAESRSGGCADAIEIRSILVDHRGVCDLVEVGRADRREVQVVSASGDLVPGRAWYARPGNMDGLRRCCARRDNQRSTEI